MNPRHRRLLIPGLLLALLVVVLVSSLARKAEGAVAEPDVVSTLSDPRITESSGLVMSREDDDLAYTINDSGSSAVVYAIEVSTGDTVGTATLDVDLVDTEALSIDGDGTLWIADTGDNRSVRDDVALYTTPEFGRTDVTVSPTARYPVTYPGGAIDVEALVVQPETNQKYLISKGLFGGTVFALPDPLVEGSPNEAEALPGDVPGVITDAAFTTDGRHVVARDYSEAYVLDAADWTILESSPLPTVDQGETLAMEASGRSYLVGSEGAGSPLIRIPFSAPEPEATRAPAPVDTSSTPPPGGNGFAGATWFWAILVIGLLCAISAAATRQR